MPPLELPLVYLGASGLVVSQVCLGTNMFGGPVDAPTAASIVDRFLAYGGNFVDTATVYHGGESEVILGTVLKGRRDEVVIAGKCYGPTGLGPNDRGASRRHIVRSVDASLRRLKTDYLDLLQLHRWDPTTPVFETLETLDDLVHSGKVLYVGASNYVGWQLERCLQIQSLRGFSPFVSLQSQYSLIERHLELETLDVVIDRGLALLAWSPLAGGLLSGKHSPGVAPSGQFGRRSVEDSGAGPREWTIVDAVKQVAAESRVAATSVAIGWLCGRGPIIPVVGASNPDQLEATCAGVTLELSGEQEALLLAVSEPARPYPYSGFPLVEGRPQRSAWR